MDNPDKQAPEKISLTAFVKERHNLMSSMGVFMGLATFFGSIPKAINFPAITWPSYVVSLLMLYGTMLLFLELKANFPRNPESRLKQFKYLLNLSYGLVVLYLLLRYRLASHLLLFAAIVFTLGRPFANLVFRIKPLAKTVVKIRDRWWGKLILFIVAAVFSFFIVQSSSFLAFWANRILDAMVIAGMPR